MSLENIVIPSSSGEYEVEFSLDFSFLSQFSSLGKKQALVIDKNVYALCQNVIDDYFPNVPRYLFDPVEDKKTFQSCFEMFDFLIEKGCRRDWTIIAIGGGITQDVTGFVADTFYRGTPWYFIPTTLLAQTDSCIGGKTSLNYGKFKNLIGSFYPPKKIFICPKFLKTLSETDYYSGLGEIIKFILISEKKKSYTQIASEINSFKKSDSKLLESIYSNLNVKRYYLINDEFDLGIRKLLNYGHCYGHALESSSDYGIPHGIAVTLGILFAHIIAMKRNLISESKILDYCTKLCLPNVPIILKQSYFNEATLLNALKNDKKRQTEFLTMIIPLENTDLIQIHDLKYDEFCAAQAMFLQIINPKLEN